MAVLEHPGFAPVFSPGSRAEAPIAGRISVRGETVPVSGRVDRLAVTSDSVFIVDFKTDREPPAEPEDVPAAYVAQLAAYRTVLAALYPGHAVRAALLWTATPSLMPLPGRLLDRALRG
jgi:ATP-dependent helicase/nuclease subunit A